jgi:hypothetical protein
MTPSGTTSQQFGLHAHADQVDPVAWIEVRVELVDGAGVGAGAALPAPVDVLAPRQRGDLIFERLVVVADDPALDKRAPVAGNVDALDFQVFVNLEVFGTDQ